MTCSTTHKVQKSGTIWNHTVRFLKNLIGFEILAGPEDAYRPQPDDTEYLTRQEMLDEDSRGMGGGTQTLLITNYSMLEYILLRPIEQPLDIRRRGKGQSR